MAKSFQVLNNAAIAQLLHSPVGPVAKDLLKRGIRVQSQAKRNLGGNTSSGPRRIDHGLLRASIATQLGTHGGELAMRVGTNVYYGLWVHDGTGIYGPRHTPIVPRKAKYLRFYWKKEGRWVFAKSVRGMKPNTYLKSALPFASGAKNV
jgi:hypothetical protein